jgi:hypothetical protein
MRLPDVALPDSPMGRPRYNSTAPPCDRESGPTGAKHRPRIHDLGRNVNRSIFKEES